MNQVKKTFFEDDSPYPSFIMERGGTKRPFKYEGIVVYLTNDEYNEWEKKAIGNHAQKYERTNKWWQIWK